ncbi:MAG: putative heat shock 70 kDa protein [Hyperionvirus sp.]|uniref:Putative heat shock 70 kDa protein n=1 Tax=Hyperionvirus sp. TaxID=2487770 RepID=A0A3G5ACA3_9VIRU|nr:MAG: putative heat shock 70 kDa protein [Hyperionvirus sp.]
MSEENIAIGIDLGTTYSCVGIYRTNVGSVEIIANDQGNKTTPSYVAFTETERLIGEAAKNQAAYNPMNTIFDIKRLIGRKFSDPGLQADLKHFPYKVVCVGEDKPMVEVTFMGEVKRFSPEEISAMILTKMKKIAEDFLGFSVRKAVITVPAYFNDSQRQATKDAGTIAGLEVIRIINEPTAAAVAHGLGKKNGEKNILIYDWGGGTLDVSVLNVENDVFEVKATCGNSRCGGEDLDNRLLTYCLSEFCKKNKLSADMTKNLLNNPRAKRRLRTECEKVKRSLSSSTAVTLTVDSFAEGFDLNIPITRAKFEELVREEFVECMKPLDQALTDSKIAKSDIDEVVLVGGSTRIPKIQQMLEKYFNKKPRTDINPDEAIAYGAAVQAFVVNGGKDDKTGSMVLLDVAPLSLGIETAGRIMAVLIPRNSTIPCRKEDTFSTYSDNQPAVTIQIFQGERTRTDDPNNIQLGRFELTGIPPMPRGVPRIKVCFDVDANGILNVSASEESSGKSNTITIVNEKGRMSKDEIDKKVKDAEMFAAQDKEIRDCTEAKNSFENYVYNVRNTLDDPKNGENVKQKLGEENYAKAKELVKKYIQWLDENSAKGTKEDFIAKQKEAEGEILPILKTMYGDAPEMNTFNEKSKEGPKVEEVD